MPSPSATHHVVRTGGAVQPFRPWSQRSAGPGEVLDRLPGTTSRRAVAEVLTEIVETEGPVPFSRLARLAAGAFGVDGTGEDRRRPILRCLPERFRDEPGRDRVAWPSDTDPRAWAVHRASTPDQRTLSDIPLREVGNAMHALAVCSSGLDRAELFRATLAEFGMTDRADRAERLQEAALLAVEDGRIRTDEGMYVAGAAPAFRRQG